MKKKTARTARGQFVFYVITLFPDVIERYLSHSILERAMERGLFDVRAVNPRDFTTNKHHKADDRPYGGGPGMVLKAEPILKAVEATLGKSKVKSHEPKRKRMTHDSKSKTKILIMSPRGKQFTNAYAEKLAKEHRDIVLIAGHYEGIDARVKKALRQAQDNRFAVEEISTGPYTVTGGELPTLLVIDAVARQIDGVLGKLESLEESRIAAREVYTRPEAFEWEKKRYAVPKTLTSGNHKEIDSWRRRGGGLTE